MVVVLTLSLLDGMVSEIEGVLAAEREVGAKNERVAALSFVNRAFDLPVSLSSLSFASLCVGSSGALYDRVQGKKHGEAEEEERRNDDSGCRC